MVWPVTWPLVEVAAEPCADPSVLCATTGRAKTARAAPNKLNLISFFMVDSLLCALFDLSAALPLGRRNPPAEGMFRGVSSSGIQIWDSGGDESTGKLGGRRLPKCWVRMRNSPTSGRLTIRLR